MKYRVFVIARCKKCGCTEFDLPKVDPKLLNGEKLIGVIVRYRCSDCGASGPKLSFEHYVEMGYDPTRMSLVAHRKTELVQG